eukprot:m.43059 g.43059  ORF g.43059 m.43059 type:complete len:327 (-) comp7087_c0_seq4:38-1018(-)
MGLFRQEKSNVAANIAMFQPTSTSTTSAMLLSSAIPAIPAHASVGMGALTRIPDAPMFKSSSHGLGVSSTQSTAAIIPWKATALAASMESFYRSGLNALINRRLTGAKMPFFPSMHVQIPTRIAYITGFKAVRQYIDKTIIPENHVGYETPVKLFAAILPGLFMTPISSVLEACNASQNKEALYKRWTRGIAARSNREIIFGIGLNQLTDNFESRFSKDWSPAKRNAAASVAAGVVAGYFSHIPHNLSALKLMNPSLSYGQHMMSLAGHWRPKLSFIANPRLLNATSITLAVIAPRGLFIRTTQVVGTFIILNGFIQAFKGTLDGM